MSLASRAAARGTNLQGAGKLGFPHMKEFP